MCSALCTSGLPCPQPTHPGTCVALPVVPPVPSQTVMIGGLARVDVLEHPGATLYLSVFVSDEVGCHLGKTETAQER